MLITSRGDFYCLLHYTTRKVMAMKRSEKGKKLGKEKSYGSYISFIFHWGKQIAKPIKPRRIFFRSIHNPEVYHFWKLIKTIWNELSKNLVNIKNLVHIRQFQVKRFSKVTELSISNIMKKYSPQMHASV